MRRKERWEGGGMGEGKMERSESGRKDGKRREKEREEKGKMYQVVFIIFILYFKIKQCSETINTAVFNT